MKIPDFVRTSVQAEIEACQQRVSELESFLATENTPANGATPVVPPPAKKGMSQHQKDAIRAGRLKWLAKNKRDKKKKADAAKAALTPVPEPAPDHEIAESQEG